MRLFPIPSMRIGTGSCPGGGMGCIPSIPLAPIAIPPMQLCCATEPGHALPASKPASNTDKYRDDRNGLSKTIGAGLANLIDKTLREQRQNAPADAPSGSPRGTL